MKTSFILALATMCVVTRAFGVAPSNDNFTNAQLFTLAGKNLVVISSNVEATTEPGEVSFSGLPSPSKSIWFRFSVPPNIPLTLSTAGSDFDTILSVYRQTSSGIGGLIALYGDDDTGAGSSSQVAFLTNEFTEYFVAVDGFFGSSGNVRLSVDIRSSVYEKVFSFTEAQADDLVGNLNKGEGPQGALVQGVDGSYFGTTRQGGRNVLGTIFRISPSGEFTNLVEFAGGNGGEKMGKGQYPTGLIRGNDGNYYGVTSTGGENNRGVIFKVTPSGSMTTLIEFGLLNPGGGPSGSETATLTLANDGKFYGIDSGTTNTAGSIYRFTTSGDLVTLVEFSGNGATNKGFNPRAALVVGSDGNFYGTTSKGGAHDLGTVFKMTPAGNLATLVEFTGNQASNKGANPEGRLVQGIDGNFYGTTREGGNGNHGTIFKMTPSGELTTLVQFMDFGEFNRGSDPRAGLIDGIDGSFYGTTAFGGNFDAGTVFKVTPAGNLTTLVDFGGEVAGFLPSAELLLGADGGFYGTTFFGGTGGSGTVFRMTPSGKLTTLVNFRRNGTTSIGSSPEGDLLSDSDGNLLGTTRYGAHDGDGSVFNLDSSGTVHTLAQFGYLGSSHPKGGLVKGNDGSHYGTTESGGSYSSGTVFRIDSSGAVTTIVSFSGIGGPNKGSQPNAGLVKASGGYLYGTTRYGGASQRGTVFRITEEGEMDTLVEFTGNSGAFLGSEPKAALIKASDGNFYGTTSTGGIYGAGTAFRLSPDGNAFSSVSFNFNGATHTGYSPEAPLVEGADGKFYGTTLSGGVFAGGTIFALTPTFELSTVIEFTGNGSANKGRTPRAGLVIGPDGLFYGTTSAGGTEDAGTVFSLTTDGVLTTLAEFSIAEDHAPKAGLVTGADGNLYGTCAFPGGSIFRLLFPGNSLIALAGSRVEGENSAVVTSKITVRGAPTNVEIEYGTGPNDMSVPIPISFNLSGFQTKLVGTTLPNLIPGTTYYYRFRATSGSGPGLLTVETPITSFSTLTRPIATATTPSELTPTTARLDGTVNARNYDTTVIFEWSSDGNNFTGIPATPPLVVTGNSAKPVTSPLLTGLNSGDTYFYRIVASNAAGTVVSGTTSFTTLTKPTAQVLGAEALSTTRAKLNGTVDPRGSVIDEILFQYAIPDEMGNVDEDQWLPAIASPSMTNESGPVTAILTGLSQGTTYKYRIRATGPGGTGLSETGSFSLSILSGLAQVFPDLPPSASGTVAVNFDPPSRGAWRFAGETAWRNSGVAATNLASGPRFIEFLPIAGYIPPPIENLDVVSGGNLVLDRMYFETASPGNGGLTVRLKPDELSAPAVPEAARAQWRFVGETPWRDSGQPVSPLIAGNYLVECKPVAGRVTPPTGSVSITEGNSSELTLTYFTANTTGAATPSPLPFSSVSANEDLPYAHVGQIRSGVGSSTGFVVKRRVVATAGHVVFDDGSLTFVKNMEWLFQRHSGQFEPKPQVPRGSYVATGYATQRIADNSPGQGSPQSQTLDYAALYFLEEAGRGGYGGFLASDLGDDNEFLTSTSQKILAGYAVDGIPAADKGKLHATAAFTAALTPAFGETWISTAVRGFGGCSGGPLFVQRPNGLYCPAAIYLGGNGQTVVRAIDSAVVDLFSRAEVSGNGGDNNVGGGITLTSVSAIGTSADPGAIRVTILPVEAAGSGRWGLKPEASNRSSGSTYGGRTAGEYVLQFTTVNGFQVPTSPTVRINGGQLKEITFTYVPDSVALLPEISVKQLGGPDIPDGGTANFGTVQPGSAKTLTFAVKNTGTASLTVLGVTKDGSDKADFIVKSVQKATLEPGDETKIKITFKPSSKGSRKATLQIKSDDGDESTYDIKLAGKCVPRASTPPRLPAWADLNHSNRMSYKPGSGSAAKLADGLKDPELSASTLDIWRLANFQTTSNTGDAADSFDPDKDGQTNLSEYAAGTDPNSAADVFKILTSTKSATTFTVTAAGKASRSYVLERRASLVNGSWTDVTSVGPLGTDGLVTLIDSSASASAGFYRIRVFVP